jgi:hypothetical protein
MVLTKTDAGRRAVKERSQLLLPRQISALILFNGVKSTHEVLTFAAGIGVTKADVDLMIGHGFLVNSAPGVSVSATTPPSHPEPVAVASGLTTNQQRFAAAWPLATQLTAGLGLRGFRLNLSVESAAGYDDLLALLPKIQAAAGAEKSIALEHALKH